MKMCFLTQVIVSKAVGEPTEMSIVDIGLMSGFVPVVSSLDNLEIANVADGISECQIFCSCYVVHA